MKIKILILCFFALLVFSCEKEIEEVLPPTLKVKTLEPVTSNGGSIEVKYSVENPIKEGFKDMLVESDLDWAHTFTVSEDKVTFIVDSYEYEEDISDRVAKIKFTYPDAKEVEVLVSQMKPEKPVVEVPVLTIVSPEPIPASGGNFDTEYSVKNPGENGLNEIVINSDSDWVDNITFTNTNITFDVKEYIYEDGVEDRIAKVSFTYPGAVEVVVNITQTKPNPVAPVELTFELEVTEIGSTQITGNSIPSILESTYVLRIISKIDFDKYASDQELITADIARFTQDSGWGSVGTIEENLSTGEILDKIFYVSLAGTEYYLIAYGLNEDGTITTSGITKIPFTSTLRPEVTLTWDDTQILPVEGGSYEAYYSIVNPIDGAEITVEPPYGKDWIHSFEIHPDKITFIVDENTTSEPNEAPREGFFAIDYPNVKSRPIVAITQEVPVEMLEFDLEIVSLTPTSVDINSVPTNLEATYIVRVISKSDYNEFGSDQELIAADIARFTQDSGWGSVGTIEENLSKGEILNKKIYISKSGAEYYLIAYGLNADGTITTDQISKKPFTSPNRPEVTLTWDDTQVLSVEGGSYEVLYSVLNPIEGETIEINPQYGVDWMHTFVIESNKIIFTIDKNTTIDIDGNPRKTFFSVDYLDVKSRPMASISQASPIE